MKFRAFQFAWLPVLIVAVAALGTNGNPNDPELQQIAGYRQWQRLTAKPMVLDASTSLVEPPSWTSAKSFPQPNPEERREPSLCTAPSRTA